MSDSTRARLRSLVALASDEIAPAWSLDTFIAVNPLLGYETTTFEDATARASVNFRASTWSGSPAPGRDAVDTQRDTTASAIVDAVGVAYTLADVCSLFGWGDVSARINERTSRWLTAFCDRGEATWAMPHKERGFYGAWKKLARHENAFALNAGAYRQAVDAMPARADDALLENLRALGIPEHLWIGYLARHLAQCAGWSGYVKHLMEVGNRSGVDLVAILAVRTWYERHGVAAAARKRGVLGTLSAVAAWARETNASVHLADDEGFDSVTHARALEDLAERERAFRDELLDRIRRAPVEQTSTAAAQFVFCIDARSEPLRRQLEAVGPYETFGFAGFFGVPLAHRPFGAVGTVAQSPALVRPSLVVGERPDDVTARRFAKASARASARDAAAEGALLHPVAAFVGVEVFGVFALLRALRSTFAPRRKALTAPSQPLDLDAVAPEDRLFLAEAALKIMGLTHDFAPVVVLCGHGGGTVNNAFAAALDCGACGGNPGLINARVACALLNDQDVRRGLAARTIAIPAETWFVAAEHDTTRDTLRFELGDVPLERRAAVTDLQKDVDAASQRNRTLRLATLPSSPIGSGAAEARAADWAQVRPEWGLARNAGFIVAPRALTRGADLEGRCFLHSYDHRADTDGTRLEQILTAPLVVAEWINLQYFFATVDPQRFGSGDKVLQQAVGGFGVVLGNGGDLRLGLPLQSTTVGQTPYHEPLRLATIIYAPIARIDLVIARQTILQRLFDNRWVSLVAIDPEDGAVRRYAGHHQWESLPPEIASCSQTA